MMMINLLGSRLPYTRRDEVGRIMIKSTIHGARW